MKSIFFGIFIFASASLFAQKKAEDVLLSLSEKERISQIFLVNVEGSKEFHPVEWTQDNHAVVPGGVLLFSYNIASSYAEVKNYIDSINKFYASNNSPLPLIAIDQEGGVVNRLKGITTYLPSQKKVKENNDLQQAFNLYSEQARQMKKLGINLNLSPVAEAETKSNKDFLATRSFGNVPDSVCYSFVCIQAYENNGVGSVAKHFPGNANTDPHIGLPKITVSQDEVYKDFIIPFAFILNANPSCVLMSHAVVSSIDEKPACMSKVWIKEILQNQIGYNGLVISDDIFMGALSKKSSEEIAVDVINSGVDVIMLSEKRFFAIAQYLLDYASKNPVFAERLFNAEKKVIEFKIKKGIIN